MTASVPSRLCITIAALLFSPLFGGGAAAQQFETWKDDPATYFQPAYPMVFVATYRDPSIGNGGNLGTDVLEAGSPSRGQELWMLLPDGSTERLFPIPGIHDGMVDYPLGPTAGRINGSVVEPSISIDGRRVYFSYFHDALNFPPFCCSSTNHSNFDGWPLGSDLYAIDLGPKLDDPAYPADQLQASRLTQTTDRYEDAMNPTVAQVLDLEFSRIQFTPDLMPSDITGTDLVQEDPDLQSSGLHITSIRDVTPIPHNGCRPPKRRRV